MFALPLSILDYCTVKLMYYTSYKLGAVVMETM